MCVAEALLEAGGRRPAEHLLDEGVVRVAAAHALRAGDVLDGQRLTAWRGFGLGLGLSVVLGFGLGAGVGLGLGFKPRSRADLEDKLGHLVHRDLGRIRIRG